MKLYMEAYANRKDITPQLSKQLTCDALLIVGAKTSHVAAAEHMHSHMDKVSRELRKCLNKVSMEKIFIISGVQSLESLSSSNTLQT